MNKDTEIWKDVVGYEEMFQVSNIGRILSKRSGKILKQSSNKDGYKTITTRVGGRSGKCICFRIHRLVAEAFLPPPEEFLLEHARKTAYGKVLVNHKNGIKSDNRIENLEWCGYAENTKHAISMGLLTFVAGENHTNSKLTTDAINFIRKNFVPFCRKNGSRALARKFGVSHSIVVDVINNKRWKHI